MSLINISKKYKIVVSVFATVLIFIGYYLSVYKSFNYQSNNDSYGNVLMIISIGMFPMLWLNISRHPQWEKYATIIPMVVFSFIIILGLSAKRKEYLEIELYKYGTNSIGIVTGFEIETHRRGKQTDYATFKYELRSKQFIQRVENYEGQFKLHQNLNLKISKRNPEMFKILSTAK